MYHLRQNQLKINIQRVPPADGLLSPLRFSQKMSPNTPLSPMSPSRSRAQQLFITQRNIDNNFQQIQKHHQQLNKYIDTLEMKVNARMEKNEGEILTAYKNHFNLVKKDMQDLKKQSQAQASNQNSYVETIQYLEKKLAIFRDQSLNLFEKLDKKQKQLEDFKMQVEQTFNQNIYLTQSVKLLTKKNKQMETQIVMMKKRQEKQFTNFEQFTNKYDISLMHAASHKNKSYRQKNRTTLTSAHHSKTINNPSNMIIPKHYPTQMGKYQSISDSSQMFAKKLRLKLGYIEEETLRQVIRVAEQTYDQIQKRSQSRVQSYERGKSRLERATKVSMRSKSNYTADYIQEGTQFGPRSRVNNPSQNIKQRQTFKYNVKQQISSYFVKCVQTIKKDITRKKQISSMNFYKEGNPISIEQFKKLDCYKLMELALSNQKVLDGLYNLLLEQNND